MIKLTSAFFICKEENCKWNLKKEYATQNAIFGHYWRKGREKLIQLSLQTKVSANPHVEPTYILADKLSKISKVNREDL